MEEQRNDLPEQNEGATAPAQPLPGAALREAREKLGLSVSDVAGQTKLAPRQIEALEADDFARLPEMPFVRGFIRSYAKVLQIDVQPLLDGLPRDAAQPDIQRIERKSVEAPFPDAHAPRVQNLVWLGAALFLSVLVVIFAVWQFTSPRVEQPQQPAKPVEVPVSLPADARVLSESGVADAESFDAVASHVAAISEEAAAAGSKPSRPEAKPVSAVPAVPMVKPAAPASAQVAPAPVPAGQAATAKPATNAAAATPLAALPGANKAPVVTPTPALPAKAAPVKADETAPVAVATGTLQMKFAEDSWVEVRNAKGELVSSQLHAAGSEFSLKGQGPYALVVGHATTTKVYFKGKAVNLAPHVRSNSDVARLTVE